MTKISFDPEQEEVQITRSIGKNGDGKITIDREGGGAIEINIGVGKIGLTSDYGGGISLGIAGQEVTWGREGGTIHIGIGGFNVDVEARDCIVTEIKSIYGHVVAQRSYPDPGCKVPDPPLPPTPTPSPDSSDPISVEVPDTDVQGWVFVNCRFKSNTQGNGYQSGLFLRRITSPIEERLPSYVGRAPMDMEAQGPNSPTQYQKIVKNQTTLWVHRIPVYDTVGWVKGEVPLHTELAANWAASLYFNSDRYPLFFWGSFREIRKFLKVRNEQNESIVANYPQDYQITTYLPYACIPYYGEVETPKLQQFLPTGNKPPMKDCCEDILDYLADFEEAFEIQRLLKDKFPVSNTFMAPECDPASVTRAKSYYEIMQCVVRMMAHGLIFEPRVVIKDADAAKAGDQEFKARYLNATGWASAVIEALMEVKDDGNVSTNMDIRSGFAATQTMVGVADAIYRLEAILDCLGIELIPKVETVETPYNVQIKIGKGFGEGNQRQIDLNTDEATEKLLPDFLRTQKNKIKTVDIHPRSRSIKEILENIEAMLPGVNNS